jgi:hypothetical protein
MFRRGNSLVCPPVTSLRIVSVASDLYQFVSAQTAIDAGAMLTESPFDREP